MAPVHRAAEALALGVTEGRGNRVQGDFFDAVADGDKISLSHLHFRAADCHGREAARYLVAQNNVSFAVFQGNCRPGGRPALDVVQDGALT